MKTLSQFLSEDVKLDSKRFDFSKIYPYPKERLNKLIRASWSIKTADKPYWRIITKDEAFNLMRKYFDESDLAIGLIDMLDSFFGGDRTLELWDDVIIKASEMR